MSIKEISVDEFYKLGLIQEINRRFLHPMGLAISVSTDDQGNVIGFDKIWNYMDDPEGMYFGDGMLSKDKYDKVEQLFQSKKEVREKNLGYHIQPVEPKDD